MFAVKELVLIFLDAWAAADVRRRLGAWWRCVNGQELLI